jgi:hypothetical protein
LPQLPSGLFIHLAFFLFPNGYAIWNLGGVLGYTCGYPKNSSLTLLFYPSLSCSKGLWDVRRLTEGFPKNLSPKKGVIGSHDGKSLYSYLVEATMIKITRIKQWN